MNSPPKSFPNICRRRRSKFKFIQNNALRASLYSVEELQEELSTLISLSRLEDKLTVVRVNRKHPSVEMHLADIEHTTIDTPAKNRVAAEQKLTLMRPPIAQKWP